MTETSMNITAVNLGTVDKATGKAIQASITAVNKNPKITQQKLSLRLRGRGPRDGSVSEQASLTLKRATKTALYLEVQTPVNYNNVHLNFEQGRVLREKLTTRLQGMRSRTNTMVLCGFKGIDCMSNQELLELMLDVL